MEMKMFHVKHLRFYYQYVDYIYEKSAIRVW